jgi:hypothetical protein
VLAPWQVNAVAAITVAALTVSLWYGSESEVEWRARTGPVPYPRRTFTPNAPTTSPAATEPAPAARALADH